MLRRQRISPERGIRLWAMRWLDNPAAEFPPALLPRLRRRLERTRRYHARY